MTTLTHLGPCPACGGTGRLGRACGYAIICEHCGGSGLAWEQHCYQPRGKQP